MAATGIANAAKLSALGNGKCILRTTGALACRGEGDEGQTGNNTNVDSFTPAVVDMIKDATTLAAGGDDACVIRGDGSVWCWGLNSFGEFASGDANPGFDPKVTAF